MRALEIVASFDRTIVGVWHFPIGKTKQQFTVGSARGATLAVTDARLVLDPHPIITIANDTYAFDASSDMVSLSDDGQRRVFQLGHVSLEVREVDAPRRQVWRAPIEWIAARPSMLCALLAVVFLVLAFSAPPTKQSLVIDRVLTDHIISITHIPTMTPPPKPATTASSSGGSGTGNQRAREPEGRRGDPEAPHKAKRERIKGSADHREYVRIEAYKAAMNSGPLSVLAHLERSSTGALFGPASTALGQDAIDALGQITGVESGASWGDPLAAGTVGSQKGGGGQDEVGADVGACTGKHCDKLFGDGAKLVDGRIGGGGPSLKGRKPSAPDLLCATPDQCQPRLEGGLSRDIVRRVVRQHRAEVKFCYERRLQHQANLDGRVSVGFTVAANGKVSQASVLSSTIANPEVGACIAQAVRAWEFPTAESGGITVVSYPFVLRTAGE